MTRTALKRVFFSHGVPTKLREGPYTGADPGFFLGGGALVSCSTSTPINHIVFFCRIPVVLENRRSSQREGGGEGAHPLHPPPRSAPDTCHDDLATRISLSHEHNEGLSLHSMNFGVRHYIILSVPFMYMPFGARSIAASEWDLFFGIRRNTYDLYHRYRPRCTSNNLPRNSEPMFFRNCL